MQTGDPVPPSDPNGHPAEPTSPTGPIGLVGRPLHLPTPRVTRSHWPFPFIWIVPLLAAIATGYYLFQLHQQRGVEITITFADAGGLKLKDTPLALHGVRVGSVSMIELDPDRLHSVVHVTLDRAYQNAVAREGAKFWLVRPDIGGGMLTGLTTVITGPYIDMAVGAGNENFHFDGLDSRPVLLGEGVRVVLHTDRLANLQIDSPVYFRGLQVGAVQDIRFSADATGVNITAFVWKRYANLLRRSSRFWVVTGTDIRGGLFSGIQVQVTNLKALLAGGVAFATPEEDRPVQVSDGANFTLHAEGKEEWLTWSAKIALPPDTNPGQMNNPGLGQGGLDKAGGMK